MFFHQCFTDTNIANFRLVNTDMGGTNMQFEGTDISASTVAKFDPTMHSHKLKTSATILLSTILNLHHRFLFEKTS